MSDRWAPVRDKYADPDTGNTLPRNQAVNLILDELNIITEENSEQIYKYDADTGIWRRDGEVRLREFLARRDKLGTQFSKRRARNIMYQVESKTYEPAAELGGTEYLLCVNNGVVVLSDSDDPILIDPEPHYRFLSALPVEFDSEAKCPNFRDFLIEVVPVDEIDKLQEFVGYCLMHWDQPFKRALLLTGPTDSGKSTFLNIVAELLGPEENVAAQSLKDLTDTRWGKAHLYGKIANIYNDLDESAIENPGQFKTLTGNDRLITAEFKYEKKFRFNPTAKFLFSANRVPKASGAGDAFHKRFLHIRFPNSIPNSEQDEHLEDRLLKESSGILNWAIEGYQRLVNNGEFTNERSIGEKKNYWMAHGNSVKQFRQECLTITGDGKNYEPKKRVYSVYRDYCREKDLTPVEYESGEFTIELTSGWRIERQRKRVDGERQQCYVGCSLDEQTLDLLGISH